MALPTDPPSVYDRGREVWNVAQVVSKRPETYGPRARKPGQSDEDWYTNVAYWMTYPEAPFEVNPDAAAQVAAWLRIREDVRNALKLPKDAASVPTEPPTATNRLLEVWNVSQVVVNRPQTYKAQVRKTGQSDDEWYTNVAYWMTYPGAPVVVDINSPAQVAAWLRLREDVRKAIFVQKNPQPWIMTKPTWPLVSAPKKWRAGSAFKAKRPWNGTQTRYHAGTDLAAVAGTAVLAPEAGTIVAPNSGWESSVDPVTKQIKGVKAIILRTDSGRTVLLGGIRPGSATVAAGAHVEAGQKIAEVGRYPLGDSMLHVQLYDTPLTEQQVNGLKSWKLGDPQPKYLVDAGPYLEAAMTNPKFVAALAEPLSEDIEGGEEAEGTVAGDPASADTAPPPSGSGGSGSSSGTTNASPVTIAAIVLAAIGVGTFLFR